MQKKLQRYKSLLFLYVELVFTWAALPFAKRISKRAWERFFSRYFPLGFLPIGLEDISQQPRLESCIGCSLCTWTCACARETPLKSYLLPKRMLLNEGRSQQDSELFAMDGLGCVEMSSCQVHCPLGIPIHQAADRILNWRRMRGFRSGDFGSPNLNPSRKLIR